MTIIEPTLTYFNGRGKGEIIRLTLTYLGVKFVDNRVSDITPLKAELPYGQVPVYKDGDIYLAQSAAIARYISNKYDFAGKTNVEKAYVDEVYDSVVDLISLLFNTVKDKDTKIQTIAKFYGTYEKRLTDNKHIAGGNDYTVADIALFFILDFVNFFQFTDSIKAFPKLQQHLDYFNTHPKLVEYIKNRPESKF